MGRIFVEQLLSDSLTLISVESMSCLCAKTSFTDQSPFADTAPRVTAVSPGSLTFH